MYFHYLHCQKSLPNMSQNGSVPNNDRESLRKAALEYHEFPVPGKLSVTPTKQLTNQRDLALAYSPGVAASSEEIVADPVNVFRYTARGNLVAVITDGTAVLGLGAIGPLAAKPVMEGKAVLFKEFAGIDVFDIEVDQRDPDKLIEVIAALEPTFGGINLEDIKAPECFYVERELRKPWTRTCARPSCRKVPCTARKSLGLPEPRRCQHRLQPAQDRGW
jgi:malate dehydrogenase (oxaloacetate-decarboxylating)(NADP+)